MATTAAQQTNTIFTIDLTNGQIALAWASIMLAIGIDTGSSGEVGALHGALLGKQGEFGRTSYDLTRLFGQCDYLSPPPVAV